MLPKNLIDNLADGKIFSDIVKPCPELGNSSFYNTGWFISAFDIENFS